LQHSLTKHLIMRCSAGGGEGGFCISQRTVRWCWQM